MKSVLVLLAMLGSAPAQAQVICWWPGCEEFNAGRDDRQRQFRHEERMRQMQQQRQQEEWAAQARHMEIMEAHRQQQMQLEAFNRQRANENFRPWCGNGMRC